METALKTIGEKYEDQLEALSKIAQQKYEDQEKQTEEYRRAFCASERQVTRLKKEKMEISHQLSVEKEALELAMKQCEEYSAASSRLANDLSAQSAETGELLLQKSETIKKIAAQRDDFHAQVTTLEQLQNQMEQDVERSTTDRTELSMQVEDLTRDLDLESKTSSKLQSELLQTQIHRDTLSQEVDDLRLELDVERKRSSEVVLQFEQAKATYTTINKEIKIVQSQLESEHQKSQKVTTMMEQLRTDLATLSVETEKLRSDLLSAHQTSEQIRQELHIAKETLSNTEVALGGVQARLEHCQSYDEFKTTAARREEENSASITELTDRIDFFRNHPFKTFFMSIIDIFKGWMNGAIRDIGNPGFSNRQLDANDENSAA
jgi:predicted  nucleic acid-binding Zn-ribbon protein